MSESADVGVPGVSADEAGHYAHRLRAIVRNDLFPPLVLLLVALIYFWPFFLKGDVIAPSDLMMDYPPWSSLVPEEFTPKNPLRSDIIDGYIPTLKQMRDDVRDGDVSLWAPERSQGRAFATRIDTSYFHPVVFLLVTVLPLWVGFSLLMVTKLYFAGLFMYLFLRKLELSKSAALLGGLAYMFSGYHIVWLFWPAGMVTAFAPLLFLQTENLVRRPSALNVGLLSLVVTLMILAGFPSTTGFFFYAVGLYFLFRVGELLARDKDWRTAIQRSGFFGTGIVLGVGLSAFVLLPTQETADFIDLSYRQSLSTAHLSFGDSGIQLIFPNYNGNQVFSNYVGPSNLNETSGYVGIATIGLTGLGILAAFGRRQLAPIFFGSVALLAVFLIYGIGPFLGWVSHLPIFDLHPATRLLSVFGFSVAVVAAYGLDALRGFRMKGRQRTALLIAAALGLVLLAGMLTYVSYELVVRRDLVRQFIEEFPIAEPHTFRLLTVAFGLSVALLFSMATFLHFRRPHALLPAAALVLIAADLLVFGYRQNPTVSRDYFYPETLAVKYLQAEAEPWERVASFDGTFMISSTQFYYGLSSSFSHDFYSEPHRQMIRAFSEGAFKTPTVVMPGTRESDLRSPLVDLLGMHYLTVHPSLDLFVEQPDLRADYGLVYAAADLRIYENLDFVPARLVTEVGHVGDQNAALAAVTAPDFDPNEEAFIEQPLPEGWVDAPADGTADHVEIVSFDRDSARYRVESDASSLLVTAELDYPGWTAEIDGESAKIYRANSIFRSVFVEPGSHEVVFSYQPTSVRRGLLITGASLAVLVVLLAYGLWRARRTSS